MSEPIEYFYNLRTRQVEQGRQSHGEDLMGPYATRAEAQRALDTAAERNEDWDEKDEEWNEWYKDPADEDEDEQA